MNQNGTDGGPPKPPDLGPDVPAKPRPPEGLAPYPAAPPLAPRQRSTLSQVLRVLAVGLGVMLFGGTMLVIVVLGLVAFVCGHH